MGIFFSPDNILVQGICVLKSNPFTFWYFCPKIGQKVIKIGLKCLGLVWYGLVWLGCDLNWSDLKKLILAASCSEFKSFSQIPGNQTFKFVILDKLKRNLGTTMTQDHNLAISNQTIPIKDILGPFLGLFDPVLGQQYQKEGGLDLRAHIP